MNRHNRLAAGIRDYHTRFFPDMTQRTDTAIMDMPDGSPARGFNRVDYNILRKRGEDFPASLKILNQRFIKGNKYDWNILAFEIIRKNFPFSSDYLSEVKRYCKEHNIPTEGRITFAFNGSSGEPLTPWMIAHKIGHGIMDETVVDRLFENGYEQFLNLTKAKDDYTSLGNYKRIFTFKSVRVQYDGGLPNGGEIPREALAQYLTTGKVPTPTVPQIGQYLEGYFSSLLERAVGNIYVDLF